MSDKNATSRSPLLPDRHPIQDFFICDVMDAIPKDDMGSMEHPIFSLATKPDRSVRNYDHNRVTVTVTPSVLGLATIHDKDVLIYSISQLVAKMNAGQPLNKTLHLKAHDLLVSTNRNTDGRGYQQLEAALDRLSGTRIKTNIKTNGEAIKEGFGLVACKNAWVLSAQSAIGVYHGWPLWDTHMITCSQKEKGKYEQSETFCCVAGSFVHS
jgi:plasmid replication initiation protein